MDNQYISIVRFDWAAKSLLRNKANFSVLEGFLSELLQRDIVIEALLESETNKSNESAKTSRVDLLLRTIQDEHILMEIQCYNQLYFYSRVLFNASKIITDHVSKGDPYSNIKKVISINIIYGDLGKRKAYLYKCFSSTKGVDIDDSFEFTAAEKKAYNMYHEVKDHGGINPEYYFIYADKFNNNITNKFDEWMYLLKNSAVKPEFDAKGIKEAAEQLAFLKLTREQQREYDRFMMDVSEQKSIQESYTIIGMEQGLEIGREEGREEGRENAIREIVIKLKNSGLSIKEIMAITNLSTDMIEKL